MKRFVTVLITLVLILSTFFTFVLAEGKQSPRVISGTVAHPPAEGTVSSRDTLTMRLAADPGTLDPNNSNSNQWVIASMVYMPLFVPVDQTGIGESFEYIVARGSLVEEYAWDEDFMGLTFKLRQGVKFTNGEEVKASDFIFSAKLLLTTTSTFYAIDFENIKALDDYTIHMPLVQRDSALFNNLCISLKVISEKAWNKSSDPASTFFTSNELVSAGPFKIVQWQSGDHVLLERNDDYYFGAPLLKYIRVRFISEQAVAMMELETGGIDVLDEPLYLDYQNVINGTYGEEFTNWMSTGQFLTMIGFNGSGMFSDYRVRKAFCLALDKEMIFRGSYDGNGMNAYTVFSTSADYVKNYKDNWPLNRNVDEAKKLLAEAGYAKGFDCRVIYNGLGEQGLALQVMKNQLSDVGINLIIQAYDTATYKSMMSNELDTWDCWCRRWGGQGMFTATFLRYIADQNMHFVDYTENGKDLIQLGEELAVEMDPALLESKLADFQDRFWDEYLFWYPIHMQVYTAIVRSDLMGATRVNTHYDFSQAYFQ
ncbi:MAG: ABC transporter substrate-binding protein [Christensenellales bacterium]|jgi:peptide/nickel transport system substrate-binding protein